MKKSRYNIWVGDIAQSNLCYNALTGGFAEFDRDAKNILDKIDAGLLSSDSLNDKEKKIYDELLKGKFIVEDDNIFDELSLQYRRGVYSNNSIGLTILPTLRCNFRCVYCYENHYEMDMQSDVVGKIKDYVKDKVENAKISSVFVNWYGGEPLLNLDAIRELSNYFIEVCERNKCYYSADIISNGWLLTDEIAKELADFRIKSYQITIDGPKKIHDKYRILPNGGSTYNRIVDAIKIASKYMRVDVRINVSKELGENLAEFFSELPEELKKLPFYPAKMSADTTQVCQSVKDICMEDKKFAEKQVEFYKFAVSHNMGIAMYPKPTTGGCCANAISSIIIGPDGSLYRCWSQVGELEESYGNILDINNTFRPENYYKWVLFDPFSIAECKECQIFPICIAGCPAKWISSTKYLMPEKSNKCSMFKYNINQYLEMIYESKKC